METWCASEPKLHKSKVTRSPHSHEPPWRKVINFFLCFRVKSLCYSVTNSFVCTARFTLRCRLWFDSSWTATCVGVQIKWGKLWKHSINHDVACVVAQHWHYHHKSGGGGSPVCSSAFIQAKHQELCMLAFELCWLHGNSLTFKWKRGCYLTRAHRVQLLTFEVSDNVMCTLVGGIYLVSLTPGASVYCVYRAPSKINNKWPREESMQSQIELFNVFCCFPQFHPVKWG